MDDCIYLKEGHKKHKGVQKKYAFIFKNNRRYVATRYLWEQTNGPIPEGLCVCHHCDNPPCVNLNHLFLGTHSDNTRDMVKKGRHVGVKNRKTCLHGHPFIHPNVFSQKRLSHPSGIQRGCKICKALRLGFRPPKFARTAFWMQYIPKEALNNPPRPTGKKHKAAAAISPAG